MPAAATIFAQLLTESLILALAGGALGVGVGYAMLQGLVAAMPRNTLPSEADLRLNIPILLFTLLATTVAGDFWPGPLLPGMHRASILPRYSKKVDAPAPAPASISCGAFSSSASSRLRLPCSPAPASLSTASGISPTSISASRPTTSSPSFCRCRKPAPKDPQVISAYYRDMLAHIAAVPGVQHTAAMTGQPPYGAGFGMPFMLEGGQTYADPSQRPGTRFGMVTPDYFNAFGIQLISGRSFH